MIFLSKQNLHLVHYLPTQIQMDILHRKTDFKRKFSRLLMYKYEKSSGLFRKKQ